MSQAARDLLGVSFLGTFGNAMLGSRVAMGSSTPLLQPGAGKTESVIFLYMQGAMSHLDTFDPKPGTEAQGETQVTQTKVPGLILSDRLPGIAKLADQVALVRSLMMETGNHQDASYWLHTSYRRINSIRHPSLSAWTSNERGTRFGKLPASILVGGAAGHPAAGFLPATYSPVPIGSAEAGLENINRQRYVTDEMFDRRLQLTQAFDKRFQRKYPNSQVDAYNEVYKEANRLMRSEDLVAFDIAKESDATRERYGANRFGQGCLLARRLVEAGCRFVEVEYNGWDHHAGIYDDDNIPEMTATLDHAVASLIEDLSASGLLDSTMVVLASEFGRTPIINENAGRDHHPGAFSALLCGGGIKKGFVYGASDETGHSVDEDMVLVEDLNATIAHALGLPLDEEFFAPNGRPFKICNEGAPILELFA